MDVQENRYLMILEVSQKQSYIFSSNALKNNIIASDIISYVTSSLFFKKEFADLYSEESNLVYSGGGHIMLTFETREAAFFFAQKVSYYVMRTYDGLEVFVKIMECSKNPAEDRKKLIKLLEMKKSIRRAGFRQGLFGMEYLRLEDKLEEKNEIKNIEQNLPDDEIFKYEEKWIEPYCAVSMFSELGLSKDESSFLAVVHIDGNLMGKRVGELDEKLSSCDFDTYRAARKEFCNHIDQVYKESYKEMLEVVKGQIASGNLKDLNLGGEKDENKTFKPKTCNFPVRRIILAGDDVCFVTDGRIGIECAVTFIKKLWEKKPDEGGKNYSACAGVTIIPVTYPFAKAYEMAEKLCSNAKKKISEMVLDGKANISAIDWHIERGEMYGTIGDIRKQYLINDEVHLEGRPYIVCEDASYEKSGDTHEYEEWKKCVEKFRSSDESLATGKLKGMYHAMKQGEKAAENYRKFHLQKEINDKEKIYLFDAIEVMDTYIPFVEV